MPYTPAPTIISAGTGTGNINQNRRIFDVSKDVAFYNPNANPFFLLAMESSKEESIDPEFRCLEAQIQPVFDTTTAAVTAVATAVNVTHGNYFKANDLVLVTRTGEIFRVTTVAANALSVVVRGYGTVAAAAMLINEELRRIGNAFEEGAAIDTPKTVQVDTITNYCEIFKTSLRLTGTEMATTLYGGMDLPLRQKMAGIEHSMKIESAFLFGQRYERLTTSAVNAATSHPIRTTQGIFRFISSNAVSIGGALTEATFNQEFLRYVFTADKNYRKKRTIFVSPLVGAIMNQWGNGKIQLVPSDKTFGITVNRYLSFFGEVNIVLHPLLEGNTYGGYALAVDLENVGYKYLSGRDTKLETDIVLDGTDARTDQFLTECGLKVRLEGVHGYAYGITG
jgi:hypothetical protein